VAEGLIEEDAVSDAVDDAEGAPGEAEPENKPVGDTGRESVN
jgi:hypothetical protein